ncbi:MAG: AMP-binding protein [Fulvivirga sp.]
MASFIQINDRQISLDEIKNHAPSSPFEGNAVTFIKLWLSGENIFELETSGSTGVPKTINIIRKQMEASARFTVETLGLKPGQTVLVCLDTSYIAGKMILVRALVNNMNIVLQPPSANPLLHLDASPDFVALVPLQLQEILKEKRSADKLDKMQAVIVGGAPVNSSLESKIQSIKAPVYATYGMTETVSHIALKKLNGADRSDVFKAFEEVKLGLDERGCLTIQSVLTNNKKIITNDRVILLDDHHFDWLGRIDNVINSGGVKVQSEKVEKVAELVFGQLNIPNRFFIAGLPDERLGEKIVLAIEAPKPLPQESLIMEMLKKQLSLYELPKEVIYISEFKETATGKMNRRQTLVGG